MTHIPYKGGLAMGDLVGGTLLVLYTAVAGAQQYVKTGKGHRDCSLRREPRIDAAGCANAGGIRRHRPGQRLVGGIAGPAKTPKEIVDGLSKELNVVVNQPETRERLATLGIVPVGNSSEAFGKQIQADLKKYGEVVKTANIKVECDEGG